MTKKNLIYILLIIFSVMFYYYQSENNADSQGGEINLSQQPIYQSDQMLTMIYTPLGQLSYEITAQQVKHFDETQNTEFELPTITIFDNNQLQTWHIKSQTAILTSDKFLYLRDAVLLNNLQPNSQLESIATNSARIDLTTQIVTSDDEVTIDGISFTSTGTGLLGNLRDKTADILENVKTYYNAPNSINSTDSAN